MVEKEREIDVGEDQIVSVAQKDSKRRTDAQQIEIK